MAPDLGVAEGDERWEAGVSVLRETEVVVAAIGFGAVALILVALLGYSAFTNAECRDAQKVAYASGNDVAIAAAAANDCY